MKTPKLLAIVLALVGLCFSRGYADTQVIDGILFECDAPFSDSRVLPTSNGVILANHGSLLTCNPGQGTDLYFSFMFIGGNFDSLKIVLRGTGEMTNVNREFDTGLFASFRVMSDTWDRNNNVSIYEQDWPVSYTGLANSTFCLNTNQLYNVHIYDSGSCLSLYINDFINPLLTINCDSDFGDYVGFSNREGAGHESFISTNSKVELSNICITPVPDTMPTFIVMIPTLFMLVFFLKKFQTKEGAPFFPTKSKLSKPKTFQIGEILAY